MIARLDHHPMLTAALALTTAVLVVVVITLATLLIRSAPPATSSSEGGANPGAVVSGTGANYGEGWNNYGYDAQHAAALQQSSKTSNGENPAIERHAEVVAALGK